MQYRYVFIFYEYIYQKYGDYLVYGRKKFKEKNGSRISI